MIKAKVVHSDGSEAIYTGETKEDIIANRNTYEGTLEAARMEQKASEAIFTRIADFQNKVVVTPPTGEARPRPTQEVRQDLDPFTGAPILGTGLTAVQEDGTIGPKKGISSDNPGALHGRAWDQGVSVERGADIPTRFIQGLTATGSPELQAAALQKYARKQLSAAGIDVDTSITPVWADENTGKIMIATPITEDSVERYGEDPANIGGIRRVMANELGLDFGDIVEFLPDAPVVASSVAVAAVAGAITKSPYVALATNTAVNSALESMNVGAKRALLKNMVGLTDEEIEAGTDPDEAIKAFLFTAGGELLTGGFLAAVNKVRRRNKNRVLTAADVEEMSKYAPEITEAVGTLDEWTGGIRLSDSDVIKSLGTMSGKEGPVGIAQRAGDILRKAGMPIRRSTARLDASNRLRVAGGLGNLTDNAINAGTDPESLARLHRDGVLTPGKGGLDITTPQDGLPQQQRVDDVGANLRSGADLDGVGTTVDSQAADAARTLEAQDKALEQIAKRRNDAKPEDILNITDKAVQQAKADEAHSWSIFQDAIGYNDTTKKAAIGIKQSPNSATSRALNRIDREGMNNLSSAFGAKDARLVGDLEALRNGTVLDANALYRLESQLGAEIRRMDTTDGLGYTKHNLNEVRKAIKDQMRNGNWVDIETGTTMSKSWQRGTMDKLDAAREASEFNTVIATDTTVDQLVHSRPVFTQGPDTVAADGTVTAGTMRKTGDYEFDNISNMQVQKLLNDPKIMRNVYDATRDNPQVKAAMSNELKEEYLTFVGRDSSDWTQTKHNAFMKKYRAQFDLTFGAEDAARITNAETMGAAVAKASARATRMTNLFTERFGKDFVEKGGLNAKSFANHVMTTQGMNAKQLSNTMDEIKRIDPDLHIQLKAEVGNYFVDRVSSGALLHGNGDQLNKLIKDEGPVLEAVLGKQYLDDVKKFQKVLKLFQFSDQSKPLTGEPIQAAWLQITRSLLGPLSRKQRFLTSYNRISSGFRSKGLLEMMADPATMKQFMKLEKMTPFTAAWTATVGRLGLEQLLSPEDQARLEELKTDLPREKDVSSELARLKMRREKSLRESQATSGEGSTSSTSNGSSSRGYTRERR